MTDPAQVHAVELEAALAAILTLGVPEHLRGPAEHARYLLDEIARERCELGLCGHDPGECSERACESALTDSERNEGGV